MEILIVLTLQLTMCFTLFNLIAKRYVSPQLETRPIRDKKIRVSNSFWREAQIRTRQSLGANRLDRMLVDLKGTVKTVPEDA